MADMGMIIGAHMRSLLARFGCLDAAAETINARWGGGASKGTLSRKTNGSLDWTLHDAIALEDASGAYPVTRLMEQRRARACQNGLMVSGIVHAGEISRETGEAVAALLAAEQSNCAGDRAQAVKEIDDAIAALKAARALLVSGQP